MDFSRYLSRLAPLYTQGGEPLQLRGGAPEQELRAAERELGFALDPQLRRAWQQADGGRRWQAVFARPGFYTGYEFLPLSEALRQRRAMAERAPRYGGYVQPHERDARIRPGWYQEGWLPFASFGGASLLLMLDHAPAAQGRRGQVIAFTHDPDTIDHVSEDFAGLLQASLQQIEADPEEFIME